MFSYSPFVSSDGAVIRSSSDMNVLRVSGGWINSDSVDKLCGLWIYYGFIHKAYSLSSLIGLLHTVHRCRGTKTFMGLPLRMCHSIFES